MKWFNIFTLTLWNHYCKDWMTKVCEEHELKGYGIGPTIQYKNGGVWRMLTDTMSKFTVKPR